MTPSTSSAPLYEAPNDVARRKIPIQGNKLFSDPGRVPSNRPTNQQATAMTMTGDTKSPRADVAGSTVVESRENPLSTPRPKSTMCHGASSDTKRRSKTRAAALSIATFREDLRITLLRSPSTMPPTSAAAIDNHARMPVITNSHGSTDAALTSRAARTWAYFFMKTVMTPFLDSTRS